MTGSSCFCIHLSCRFAYCRVLIFIRSSAGANSGSEGVRRAVGIWENSLYPGTKSARRARRPLGQRTDTLKDAFLMIDCFFRAVNTYGDLAQLLDFVDEAKLYTNAIS